MIPALRKLLAILDKQDKIKISWLIAAGFGVGLFDMLGVASIFPFLKVVSDPSVIHSNEKLRWLYNLTGFSKDTSFIILLGIIIFVILLCGNIFRSIYIVSITRLTWMKRYSMAKRLLTQYLYEPYVFFLNRNSALLTNYLMTEVGQVVGYVLMPSLNMFAKLIFVLLMIGFLIFVNPVVTFIIVCMIGGGYALIYFSFKTKMTKTGFCGGLDTTQ